MGAAQLGREAKRLAESLAGHLEEHERHLSLADEHGEKALRDRQALAELLAKLEVKP